MKSLADLYTLTFESRPAYLYVLIEGDLSAAATLIHAWEQIVRRCRQEEKNRLLVVHDVPEPDSTAEAFTAAASIVELGLEGIKIALTDVDPANLESHRFCELVASNRGANVKALSTTEEAEKWLLRGYSQAA